MNCVFRDFRHFRDQIPTPSHGFIDLSQETASSAPCNCEVIAIPPFANASAVLVIPVIAVYLAQGGDMGMQVLGMQVLYFLHASRRCCGLLVSSPVLCFSPV